ncbi:MAG TPA: AI-2E family transporter [Gemmatimonadales bacterium]|nr:AI-2E family transporter [Gemmatimonadales bacterium]
MTVPPPRPDHLEIRELAGFALAALLFGLLVLGVIDALTPPLVYGLFVWSVWPLRARGEVRTALAVSTALVGLWFLGQFGAVLTPFVASIGVAYVIAPVVGWLTARRVPRGLAILLVVLPVGALIVTVILVSGPQLVDQSQALVTRLPDFAHRAVAWLAGFGDRLARLPFLSAEQKSWLDRLDADRLAAILQGYAQGVMRNIGDLGLGLLSHARSLVALIAFLVVVPVVTFYLLLDWTKFTAAVKGLVPPSRLPGLVAFVQEYDRSLGRYVRGTLLEAALVGTVTTLLLLIFGVPGALLLGVIAGAFNVIPYIGFTASILPALVSALTMADPVGGLLRVVITFAAIQVMDGHITGPKIVGTSVGLHPIWIMVAMALSGTFFGFVGLLLAVPLAVLVKMLLVRGVARYKSSTVYNS